ncbi:hypothetical protein [Pseudomonas sp. GM50]|uniref:hypothetical protein n=1 Tax=Pseudomonas sp. GM50 TaxID=1144332 RepID=UPI001EE67B2C|nr:hypothetical protein [Pseudomonas sp. GM50]
MMKTKALRGVTAFLWPERWIRFSTKDEFGWVTILPYLLVAGYVCAGLTVALYRTVFS